MEGSIQNEQPRDTGNIEYTRHRNRTKRNKAHARTQTSTHAHTNTHTGNLMTTTNPTKNRG